MFKCSLIKLYTFENGVYEKNFGVPGPSSKMARFQNRRTAAGGCGTDRWILLVVGIGQI
jgi:hypothetical protein